MGGMRGRSDLLGETWVEWPVVLSGGRRLGAGLCGLSQDSLRCFYLQAACGSCAGVRVRWDPARHLDPPRWARRLYLPHSSLRVVSLSPPSARLVTRCRSSARVCDPWSAVRRVALGTGKNCCCCCYPREVLLPCDASRSSSLSPLSSSPSVRKFQPGGGRSRRTCGARWSMAYPAGILTAST